MTKADQSEKPALLGFHIRERETTVIWADETSREPEVKRAAVTAGEIARSAISTIWITPNSTSCCSVRVDPMSKAPSSSGTRSGLTRLWPETCASCTPAGTN